MPLTRSKVSYLIEKQISFNFSFKKKTTNSLQKEYITLNSFIIEFIKIKVETTRRYDV